ncbi:MAG: hypothetical protein AAFX00_08275 [Pseudomonadota bacterium]
MKVLQTVFLCTSLVLLTSCNEEDAPPIGQGLVASQVAACEQQGGRFGAGGRPNTQVCYVPEPDANKRCESADECSGYCLARSGTCTPVTPIFGCIEVFTSRGERVERCLD